MTWNDITLKTYNEIQNIINNKELDDLEQTQKLVELIFNVENSNQLPLTTFTKYVDMLKFLQEPINETKIKDKYTINDKVYVFKGNIAEMTTGQYLDFENYSKIENNLNLILSVFLIPEGFDYCDGYSLLDVQNDILELPIVEVISIMNFFQRALLVFLETTRNYLNKTLKGAKTDKADIEKIDQMLKTLTDMVV